jgi:hypothetical protein
VPELGRFQERFVAGLVAETPIPGIFSSPGFAVYRNTWRKALVDALKENYPVVAALVGPDAFQALALTFIAKQAAPSPILAAFGAEFVGFIESHPIRDDVPYLADIARLERLRTEAHLAHDAVPADPVRFLQRLEAGLDHGTKLHPSVRFGWFGTPAVTIWQAHQRPEGFESLAPDWVAEGALVVRRAGRVRVVKIGRGAYRLFSAIQAGQELLQAAEAAAASESEDEAMSALMMLACNEALSDQTKEE